MTYLDSTALDSQRQILALTERIANEKGLFAAVALANGAKLPRITSTKLEKKIQKEGRIKSDVTTAAISGFFDGTARALVVADTKNFLVGDILEFRTATNKSKGSLTLGVDSITNGTTLSVIKVGGADIAVNIGDYTILRTSSKEEGSDAAVTRPMHLPTTLFNNNQIINESRKVTGTAMEVNNYDLKSATKEARRQVLEYFGRQLDAICFSNNRATVVLGGKSRKIAAGLPFFMNNLFDADGAVTGASTANETDASAAALTQSMIDDAFQYIIENEGRLNTIMTSPAQIRKISAFDEGKIVINYDEASRGGSVQVLKSPITINGNVIDKMYISNEVAKDEVILFDRSKAYLLPMKNRSYKESVATFESTDGATDGTIVTMLGEWSFLFENADIYSYKIKNLAI